MGGWLGVEKSGKKEKGLMDMDKSVANVGVGRSGKGINGSGKIQ